MVRQCACGDPGRLDDSPGLRWVFDGPTIGDGRRPAQRLPICLHSLLAALGSSAMSSVNALAVILPRSGFWNSGCSRPC
ncbi:hypothetical protein M877_29475 [Streptomyces niveus NCIMB 11891]|nr:hypothetical protein M877_29475 [Streptomyces niveus NCIMB 11891]